MADELAEDKYSRVVEYSLQALLSGKMTLEEILARYPQYHQELREELAVAKLLSLQSDSMGTRPGFITASRKRLVERIQTEVPAQSNQRFHLGWLLPRQLSFRTAAVVFFIAILFFSSFGAVSASQGTIPGDQLYGLKRLSEDVQYTFTVNPESRAQLSLEFSDRRLHEAELLIVRGNYGAVPAVLADFEYKVNQSIALLQEQQTDDDGQVDALATNLSNELARQTEQLNYLLGVAPEAAHDGLENALRASQHGYQTAAEMIHHGQSTQAVETQESDSTPDPSATQPGNRQNETVDKTKVVPPGLAPSEEDTNPGQGQDKKATNENKPTKETKPENPGNSSNGNEPAAPSVPDNSKPSKEPKP